MAQIDDLPPLRDVIRRHGLSAKKSLGQNFLLDLNLTARIARAGGALEGATVVEVGPGPGGLTRALLAEGAKQVIAIERDQRAIAALEEIAARYPGRLEIIPGDALEFDTRQHLGDRRAIVVANLPYNIATALLIGWLTVEPWPPWYDALVLMFQREVAERIAAKPGRQELWPAVGIGELALRNQDPVRRGAVGLRAAAQGHVVGGSPDTARRAARLRRVVAATSDRGGVRTTPQDAASEPQVARASTPTHCSPQPASSRPRGRRRFRWKDLSRWREFSLGRRTRACKVPGPCKCTDNL